MIDLFTAKQWFYIAAMAYVGILFVQGRIFLHIHEMKQKQKENHEQNGADLHIINNNLKILAGHNPIQGLQERERKKP